MTNQLDLKQFNNTNVVKKLSKSNSIDNLETLTNEIEETTNKLIETTTKILDETTEKKRGRKSKYSSEEERKEARRKQQREYRLRKKQELEELKRIVKENQ